MKKNEVFHFYLKNWATKATNATRAIDPWMLYMVAETLKSLFDTVCKHPGNVRFSHSEYHWTFEGSNIKPHELLVYILPTRNESLVSRSGGKLPPDVGGATFKASCGIISEAYVEKAEGDPHLLRLLGLLIFHEWMHNKLDADNVHPVLADLHKQGGEGLATGGGIESRINYDEFLKKGYRAFLTSQNIQLMSNNLGRENPQCISFVKKVPWES